MRSVYGLNVLCLRIPAVGHTACEGLIAPRTQLVEFETDRQISASGL